MSHTLDILAFGAHPDDVEMSAGGTIAISVQQGKRVGIIDLTEGELGTRGNATLRRKEAKSAQLILGVEVRENLKLKDGQINTDQKSRLKIVEMIRLYRPRMVLCNALYDRHPDHGRAATLVRDAFFLSGLPKLITKRNGKQQEAWRPFRLLHYIQDMDMKADFFVDISEVYDIKKEAILAFSSQFHQDRIKEKTEYKKDTEQQTYISSPHFMEAFDARYKYYGKQIGVNYAEPFLSVKPLGVTDLDVFVQSIY